MGAFSATGQQPTQADAPRDPQAVLAELLRRPRYEVLPLDGAGEAVLAHVPVGARVAITASPSRGIGATLVLAEELAAHGYNVVPHLPARLVQDRVHLHELVVRLKAAGIRELFVPAGDARQPAGEFAGAAALLTAMGRGRAGFAEIGITGYPESHHLISDEATIEAMFAKAPMATCIVSQLCFDPGAIAGWIAKVRARGTQLPIWIGVPGIIDYRKLIRITGRIGLGESARFLRHHRAWASRLLTLRFKPDGLIDGLMPCLADPAANVAGFHVYTFNELARTERWRREMLARLDAGA